MKIAAALAVAIMRLRSSDSAPEARRSAAADAQILLGEVLQADRAWMLAHGDEELDSDLLEVFGLLLDERMRGVPIPYLTHRAGFYGREFYVDERVLIPRPETEHVVEEMLAKLRALGRAPRVLDVGTGCGALAVTFAAEIESASVVATDVSADALDVARRNACEHNVASRVEFLQSDVAEDVDAVPFDCVVANLPYIPTAEIPLPPDPVGFEPRLALDGGSDGLVLYRRLIPRLPTLLAPGGTAILEAAPPTIAQLAALVRAADGRRHVEIGTDYAGCERFVVAGLTTARA